MIENWEVWTYQLSSLACNILQMKYSMHITGFLGEVFESGAADKWPEVSR